MSKRTTILDGNRIKLYRLKKGWSQAELAKRLVDDPNGELKSTIDRIGQQERTGRVWEPFAEPLAKALGVSLEELAVSDNDIPAEWWVQHAPWHFHKYGAYGGVLPEATSMAEYVGDILEQWRISSEQDLRLHRDGDVFKLSIDGDKEGREAVIRRVRVADEGLRWTHASDLEVEQADRALRRILFDHAEAIFIHGERHPSSDDGMTIVVETSQSGRRVTRQFKTMFDFNASCRTWLRQHGEFHVPFEHKFRLDPRVHGIEIERSCKRYGFEAQVRIYKARADEQGRMVVAPWIMSERKALLTVMPKWHQSVVIWPGDDEDPETPIPPFGIEEEV